MSNANLLSPRGHTDLSEPRELLIKADEAQAAGDDEECIELIRRVYETFERQVDRPVRVMAAAAVSTGSFWIGY